MDSKVYNELELIREYQFIDDLIAEHGIQESLIQMQNYILMKIYNHTKGLCISICHQIEKLNPKELYSVCFFSVKYAVEKYDTSSQMKFSSYLAMVLKRDLVRVNHRTEIYIPYTIKRLLYKYNIDKPKDLDFWIKQSIEKVKSTSYTFDTIKSAIIKYGNVTYLGSGEYLNSVTIPSFEDDVINKVPSEIFEDMKKIVGDKYCNLIKLKFVDGLSLREIAEKLDCSHNNIHTKIKNAVNKLKNNYWFVSKYKNFIEE